MRTIEIEGKNFSNLSEFYDEIERKFQVDLDFKFGRNLDALNDILEIGFGIEQFDNNYVLNWNNSEKSKIDLGRKETIKYLEKKLDKCHPTGKTQVKKDLENVKIDNGSNLFDRIVQIIKEHDNIDLNLT